jgi:D-alanine--poly(phosphoribitol) ligase subunit 1
MTDHEGLGRRILAAAARHSRRVAVTAYGEELTYDEFASRAACLARSLTEVGAGVPGTTVAILTDRSCETYLAVAAVLFAGAAYVPLNPRFPLARNRQILESSAATALIVDAPNAALLPEMLAGADNAPTVVAASAGALTVIPPHLSRIGPAVSASPVAPPRGDGDLAYLLFTSGTTGVPKGVPITHGNVAAYLRAAAALSGIGYEDRLIQVVDLTFDLSVHDMFLTWCHGAALHSVPERASLLALRVAAEDRITGWMSVPSTAALAYQLLAPNMLPELRFTFFCGEALPTSLAAAWGAAAPNSAIYNLYGPTEATVAISGFRVAGAGALAGGVVPIGEPFPGQKMALFDERGSRAEAGGEICVSGSQVTSGYWNAPDLTATRFFEHRGERWYRTGDQGHYDPAVGFVFAGRTDHQVKIRGFRVELQEIEAVVRTGSGSALVAAVPVIPDGGAAAIGCAVFVVGDEARRCEIWHTCRRQLPDYMVPLELFFVAELPVNANGKTDYARLRSLPEVTVLARAGQ